MTSTDLHALRVLLVEDDDILRDLLLESFTYLGADPIGVATFADGVASLAHCESEDRAQFDIVVSDLVLDGEPIGVDLLDIASKACHGVMTLLISGLDVDARILAGEHRLLAKPFGVSALLAVLTEH